MRANAMIPMIRNAHAIPKRWMRASMVILITAPPIPEPENTIPVASPRLRLKYCAGRVDPACKRNVFQKLKRRVIV